jgi:hypothetical protein
MNVIAHHGPILKEVAKRQEDMLCQIGDGNDQERAGTIGYPGIMRLHERRFLRDAQTTVADLANPFANVGQDDLEVERTVILPLRAGGGITIVEHIDAVVVCEKCLAGVKTCSGGKRSSGGRAGIV